MRSWATWVSAALVLLALTLPSAGAIEAAEPSLDPPEPPGPPTDEAPTIQHPPEVDGVWIEKIEIGAGMIRTGDIVPVRVVLHTPPSLDERAKLQVLAAHAGGTDAPRPTAMELAPGRPNLLVAFWEPQQAGTYHVGGFIAVGEELIPLEDQVVEVQGDQPARGSGGKVLGDERGPEALMWAVAVGVFTLFYARRRGS